MHFLQQLQTQLSVETNHNDRLNRQSCKNYKVLISLITYPLQSY